MQPQFNRVLTARTLKSSPLNCNEICRAHRAMLIIFTCLTGAILGLYFSVLLLITVTALGAGLFLAINGCLGQTSILSLGQLGIMIASFQAGFFVGLTGRPLYAALLARLAPKATRPT